MPATPQTSSPPPLTPGERDLYMKERATLLDRLVFVEGRLGLPSSLLSKAERRQSDYAARIRAEIGRQSE